MPLIYHSFIPSQINSYCFSPSRLTLKRESSLELQMMMDRCSEVCFLFSEQYKQVGLEAFINLAKSSKLLDLTTPSFKNVER